MESRERENLPAKALPAKAKDERSAASQFGRYMNIGLLMPIATFVGYAMGYGLDRLFSTTWIRYVFLVFGMVSGFIETMRDLDKDN